jgi:L-serine dehydratase
LEAATKKDTITHQGVTGLKEMEFISIFNDVLGPVMRGPSSSHTAGSYRIGKMARALFGDKPTRAVFTFDPQGSYAKTFRGQGADLGFAAGLQNWEITDNRFPQAMESAAEAGLKLEFKVAPLEKPGHPNTVEIELSRRRGNTLRLVAHSAGGGLVHLTSLNDWEVNITGKAHSVLVEAESKSESRVLACFEDHEGMLGAPACLSRGKEVLVHVQSKLLFKEDLLGRLGALRGVKNVWTAPPLFYIQQGEPLFRTASEMVARAQSRGFTLGRAGLENESALLGLSEGEVLDEMLRRWGIMRSAIDQGLQSGSVNMQLLAPSAAGILRAEARGRLAAGGLQTRAAARAMGLLHWSSSGGVVCAAPTGASSGVIPGVLATLAEEKNFNREKISLALFAAGAIGLVIARRATFAAEIAGCQVEIGAAGAMAAAAVVEAAGGTPQQAADAAAVSLQNTMGSVCDLVQGICEIPCHTRNAAAAASAFLCADLILGGYVNPIPLDETVDAVFSVGKMLPRELRCTSLGGLAVTPSARDLARHK